MTKKLEDPRELLVKIAKILDKLKIYLTIIFSSAFLTLINGR